MRKQKIISLTLVFLLIFGCGEDTQSKRKIGSKLDGEWAFGPYPNCENPKSIVTISGRDWKALNQKHQLIKILEMLEIKRADGEILIDLEYGSAPEIQNIKYRKTSMYFKDSGNKLTPTALKIRDRRVELDAIGITIYSAPHYWLIKC